jgi:hypothetical protein
MANRDVASWTGMRLSGVDPIPFRKVKDHVAVLTPGPNFISDARRADSGSANSNTSRLVPEKL